MQVIPLSTSAATGSPAAPAAAGAAGSAYGGIGKNDFLKLLVAQLRNQDPYKPMEDKEFISQMAQLNTLEQMTDMNAKLDEFIGLQEASEGSALLGKHVEATGANGASISGVVEKVRMDHGQTILVVGGKEVRLSDIKSIGIAQSGK